MEGPRSSLPCGTCAARRVRTFLTLHPSAVGEELVSVQTMYVSEQYRSCQADDRAVTLQLVLLLLLLLLVAVCVTGSVRSEAASVPRERL